MNQQGVEFLNAFEAYVKRRRLDEEQAGSDQKARMVGFDQKAHIVKFDIYLKSLHLVPGSKLYESLMGPIRMMLGPEPPRGSSVGTEPSRQPE